jgi:hypothetical protein
MPLPNKPGYIYLLHIPHDNVEWRFDNDLYKIGYTSNLKSRAGQIGYQWNQNVSYVAFAPVADVISSEKQLLKKYDQYRFCEKLNPWMKNVLEYFLFEPMVLDEVIYDVWKYCDRNALVEKPYVSTSDALVKICRKNLSLLDEIETLKLEKTELENRIQENKKWYDERNSHYIYMINQLVKMTPYYDYDLESFAIEYVNTYFHSKPIPTNEEFRKIMDKEMERLAIKKFKPGASKSVVT